MFGILLWWSIRDLKYAWSAVPAARSQESEPARPTSGTAAAPPRPARRTPRHPAPHFTPAQNTFAQQHECWPNNCDSASHSLGKITHFPIFLVVEHLWRNKAY